MNGSRVDDVLDAWRLAAHSPSKPIEAPRPRGRRSALPLGLAGTLAAVIVIVAGLALRGIGSGPAPQGPSGIAATSALPASVPPATPTPLASPSVAGSMRAAAIAFFDPERGLLGGGSSGRAAIWRTDDGGRTWAPATVGEGSVLAIGVFGGNEAWASTDCPSGSPATCRPGVLHSADAGGTWSVIAGETLQSISFVSPTDGWAVRPSYPPDSGSRDGILVRSTDGGRTWHPVNVAGLATGPWQPRAVAFVDGSHGWVALGSSGGGAQNPKAIVVTRDGGRSWEYAAAVPPPGNAPNAGTISIVGDVTGLAMRSSGVGTWWSPNGGVETTADGGRTWVPSPLQNYGATTVQSVTLVDDRRWLGVVWNASDGSSPQTIQSTNDGGRTWQIVSSISLPPGR